MTCKNPPDNFRMYLIVLPLKSVDDLTIKLYYTHRRLLFLEFVCYQFSRTEKTMYYLYSFYFSMSDGMHTTFDRCCV